MNYSFKTHTLLRHLATCSLPLTTIALTTGGCGDPFSSCEAHRSCPEGGRGGEAGGGGKTTNHSGGAGTTGSGATSARGGAAGANSGGASAAAGTGDGGSVGSTDGGEGGTSAGEGGTAGESSTGGNPNTSGGAAGGEATTGGTGVGGGSTSGGTSTSGGKVGTGGITSGGSNGTGGKASGGTIGVGGTAIGGSASGGKASGGTASGGKASGGTGSGGTANAGSSSGGAVTCAASETACSKACVKVATDRDNCGACGVQCESYQFCAASKCLPTYQSTRVQPLTAQSTGVSVLSGAVARNKAQGDLVLQLDGGVTLSSPSALATTTLSGRGYARYTSSGALVWGRSSKQLLNNEDLSWESPVALTPTGDLAIGYEKYVAPTGPVAGTYDYVLGRIRGTDGALVWEAKLLNHPRPDVVQLSGVIPRSSKDDFISYERAFSLQVGGGVYQVVDSGTSGSGTKLAPSYASETALGADGVTLWTWGAVNSTVLAQLNPWSSQTWQLTSNPFQLTGGDAYLLGARDDGTTIGPWFSEGDSGVLMHLVVDSVGDLIVVASSSGYGTFNGGQDFFTTEAGGVLLAKIRHTDGKVLWRMPLSTTSFPDYLILLPGDRIVTPDTANSDGSYTLGLYSGADGSLLSRIPVNSTARVQVLVAGSTEMFLAGSVNTAVDFNPGAGVDTQGSTAGLFITRYAF